MTRNITPKISRNNAFLDYFGREGKAQTTEEVVANPIDNINKYLKVKRKVESWRDRGAPQKRGRWNNSDEDQDEDCVQLESNNDDKKDENKEKGVSFAGTKINSDASLKDDESIMGTTLSFLTCREEGENRSGNAQGNCRRRNQSSW